MTLEVTDYSDKAIAVFGDTKKYKDVFSSSGGMFNASLRYTDGNRRPGWVYKKSEKENVLKLVNDINGGKFSSPEEKEDFSDMDRSQRQAPLLVSGSKTKKTEVDLSQYVEKKAFLNAVSRIEKLEQELGLLLSMYIKPDKSNSVKDSGRAKVKSAVIKEEKEDSDSGSENEEDDYVDSEEERNVKPKRLLKSK